MYAWSMAPGNGGAPVDDNSRPAPGPVHPPRISPRGCDCSGSGAWQHRPMGSERSAGSQEGSAAVTVGLRASAPARPATHATLSIEPIDAPAEADLHAGWAERGRYALVEEIARGGGGRIAIAIDRKLRRRVALKRPLERDGGERLAREALVLARLEHPAIVPIHDVGEDAEGAPFYAMKLLGGQTLADRMRAATTFEQRVGLLAAVTTVADAVAYAHSEHVIHRDLKPANVLVGEFGEIALIDWGLGKIVGDQEADAPTQARTPAAESDLTAAGALVGTPAYMAPEQARGEEVDERADVYALGVTLYQLLAGALPYGDRDAESALAAVRAGPPPPLARREPRVPDDLAAIVAKAMARAPADRYRSGRELAEDLHRYQTGRLVAAHRYRLTTRARRWLGRHRAAIAIGTAIVAVGGAAVLVLNTSAPPDPCAAIDAPVAAVWNPAQRAALARAFAGAVSFGAATWTHVGARLDDQAAQIGSMRRAACHATHASGEQSTAQLALRMRCLDARLDELRGAIGAFGHADAALVAHSDRVLDVLGRVDDCADVARLADLVPLPADPARRAAIEAVERTRPRLAELEASGHLDTAPWLVTGPAVAAFATGYPPLVAHFEIELANLNADDDARARWLWAAVATADRAHDDVVRGRALNHLIDLEVNRRERYPEAAALIDQALAVADRTHDQSQLAELTIYRSHVASALGHVDDEVALSERALDLATRGAPQSLAHARFNLGGAYADAGRFDDADRILGQVVDELREKYGTFDHPDVGRAIANLAAARSRTQGAAAALVLMNRARTIFEHTGPARELLQVRGNIALAEDMLGHADRAQQLLLALLPDTEAMFGHDSSTAVTQLINLGVSLEHSGRFDDALVRYRDALARALARAPDTAEVAHCRTLVGSILVQTDRPREALPELAAALAIHSALTGPDGAAATDARADLGRALLDTGDPRRAIVELERAVAAYDRLDDKDYARGLYRTALAQAYWATGQRDRAQATAVLARRWLTSVGEDGVAGLAELADWERARK
jgi:tetratricopeptide (TPR) repeat protein